MHEQPAQVVAVMGSYRRGGTIDTAVAEVLEGAREQGARTRKVDLIDQHLEFCRNCRQCTQAEGEARGVCALHDDMAQILTSLEEADAIVLGAPVNFGDVNALTRMFLERTLGAAHWPWGKKAPRLRRQPTKPAVLVTSSAAPAVMTRFLASPLRTLRQLARMLGARATTSLVLGFAADREPRVGARQRSRARRLGRRLVRSARRDGDRRAG